MTQPTETIQAIAFDFDGTLVDTAPGILRGMKLALDKNALQPCTALNPSIIGPPLKQTLALLCGSQDEVLLDQLVSDFKQCYDSDGYRDTIAYPAVGETLTVLQALGHPLYLATNKRGIPTRLILDHLGWSPFFQGIYCLDEHPDCPDKTSLLAKLLRQQSILPQRTPYIGDTEGDARAALANAMPYFHVSWGYGEDIAATVAPIDTPQQLLAMLADTPH